MIFKYITIYCPLLQQSIYIRFFNRMIFGDAGITSAVGAKTFTKWQMNIKAYAILPVTELKSRFYVLSPKLFIKSIFVPVRNGGIAGITRRGHVIFIDQVFGKHYGK